MGYPSLNVDTCFRQYLPNKADLQFLLSPRLVFFLTVIHVSVLCLCSSTLAQSVGRPHRLLQAGPRLPLCAALCQVVSFSVFPRTFLFHHHQQTACDTDDITSAFEAEHLQPLPKVEQFVFLLHTVCVCVWDWGKKMAVHWGLCCAQKSAGMKFHQQHVVSQCHYWITYWVTVMLFTVTHFD